MQSLRVHILPVLFVSMVSTGTAWPDCSASDASKGDSSLVHHLNATAEDGTLVFVSHPQPLGNTPYPVMVFSHGTTGEFAMYERAIEAYVSNGFIVIFPHVKGPTQDVSPLTLDPHGDFAIKGVHFATAANSNASSPLHGRLDLKNLVLAGHSMGASTTPSWSWTRTCPPLMAASMAVV